MRHLVLPLRNCGLSMKLRGPLRNLSHQMMGDLADLYSNAVCLAIVRNVITALQAKWLRQETQHLDGGVGLRCSAKHRNSKH